MTTEEATKEATPKCSVELIPMAEWVQKENDDPARCNPCMLAPVLQWYRETLKEAGLIDRAANLEKLVSEAEPLTICKELDNIKKDVEAPLRERLMDFDCAIQSYTPDDEE